MMNQCSNSSSSSAFSIFRVDMNFHSPHFRFGHVLLLPMYYFTLYNVSLYLSLVLPIFLCPLTAIFHGLITTFPSVSLATDPNHLSLASLIFSLMFAKPAPVLISCLDPLHSHHPSEHFHLCSF